ELAGPVTHGLEVAAGAEPSLDVRRELQERLPGLGPEVEDEGLVRRWRLERQQRGDRSAVGRTDRRRHRRWVHVARTEVRWRHAVNEPRGVAALDELAALR